MALISLVSVIGFFSGCGTPYGTMGGFSEIQLAPDIYRVSFSPYGYIPWDLAYQAGLPHCAALAIQNGYRYFGVLTIKNYGSGNSFSLPRNSYTYRTSNGRRNRDLGAAFGAPSAGAATGLIGQRKSVVAPPGTPFAFRLARPVSL